VISAIIFKLSNFDTGLPNAGQNRREKKSSNSPDYHRVRQGEVSKMEVSDRKSGGIRNRIIVFATLFAKSELD